jgi:hypothetical protein
MIAFARGSATVGELLTMVGEEDRRVALPAAALAEAFRVDVDGSKAMLWLLARHERATVAPLDAADAEPVGMAARAVPLGVAHAVVLTSRTKAYLATTSAKSLAGLVGEELIIEI